MTCRGKQLVFLWFALFYVQSYAQSNVIKDRIERCFADTYKYKKKAQNHLVLEQLSKVIELSDSIEDNYSIAKAYMLKAEIEIEQNYQNFDTQDVSDLLERAAVIQKSLNDSLSIGYNYMLQGLMATRDQSYGIAASQFNKAGDIFIKYRSLEYINKLKFFRGLFYLDQGINKRAITEFENSLPLSDSYEPNYLRSRIYLNLAKAYRNIKRYEDAKLNSESALDIAISYNFPLIKLESLKIIAAIHYALENPREAFIAQKRYSNLSDSIHAVKKTQLYAEADARFDNQFKERHISQLTLENTEETQKGKRNKLTSILSSALLIIISLLTISLYRNNQIKVKTNNLLLKKNSELQLAKDNAEKAMKAKAHFLSTVTHELRTPLYAVTGLTHLLLEENPSESQKEYLKSLKFSGDYLLTFINDILQVNKIEAKKVAVEKVELDLHKVLEEVVKSLTQTSTENDNEIILSIDKSVSKHLIGDSLKMSQIFINLISNALKFTKNGLVHISAVAVSEDIKSQTIEFSVTDNGIGISESMQENIFESFSQGSVQINRKYGGTGLGLTIVKSLLELLESEIKLKSELGKGSTFHFTITLEKAQIKEASQKVITVDKIEEVKLQQFHVLLVEDNKINQVITKKIISKQNMSCDIANDGHQAIDLAQNNSYDFILMDIHMPGISGIEATKEIRKFDPDTPIIALTAISLDENKGDFLSSGFNEVISKPFNPKVFYEKITRILF